MPPSPTSPEQHPWQIDDGLTTPGHDQPLIGCDDRDSSGLQVLGPGKGGYRVGVSPIDHDSHALLALGDGQFGAVQAVVLLGHGVEVDAQSVS